MFGARSRQIRIVRDYIDALNARDQDAVGRIYAPDCKLIDSKGGWIGGYDNCVEASRRFFEMPFDYHLEIDSISARLPDILVRGQMRSTEPRLANDTLWRAQTDGKRLTEWASFARGKAYPTARVLMPEAAQSTLIPPGWTVGE